jgi:hypothetical protein
MSSLVSRRHRRISDRGEPSYDRPWYSRAGRGAKVLILPDPWPCTLGTEARILGEVPETEGGTMPKTKEAGVNPR